MWKQIRPKGDLELKVELGSNNQLQKLVKTGKRDDKRLIGNIERNVGYTYIGSNASFPASLSNITELFDLAFLLEKW